MASAIGKYPYWISFLRMDGTFCRTVIREALESRRGGDPDASRTLNDAIRKHLRIKGWTHSENAPLETLQRGIAGAVKSQCEPLARAVLLAWFRSQSVLRPQVALILQREGFTEPLETVSDGGFGAIWRHSEMKRIADLTRTGNPGISSDCAALMACCLTGRGLSGMYDETDDADDVSPDKGTDVASAPDKSFLPSPTAKPISGSSDANEDQPESGMVKTKIAQVPRSDIVPEIVEKPIPEIGIQSAVAPDDLWTEVIRSAESARRLAELGDFSALKAWVNTFENQCDKASTAFRLMRDMTIDESRRLSEIVCARIPLGDAEMFVSRLSQIGQSCEILPAELIARADALRAVRDEIESYHAQRSGLLDAIAASEKLHTQLDRRLQLLVPARQIQDGASIISYGDTSSLSELCHAAEKLNQRCRDTDSRVSQMRSEILQRLTTANAQMLARLRSIVGLSAGLEEVKAKIDHLVADVSPAMADDALVSANAEAEALAIQLEALLENASIETLAGNYLTTRKPADLSALVAALWAAQEFEVGFALMSCILRGGLWSADTPLPRQGIDHFLRGLTMLTDDNELLRSAVDFLSDGTYIAQINVLSPDDALGLLILYAAAACSSPDTITGQFIWDYHDKVVKAGVTIPATWKRLCEALMLDEHPKVKAPDNSYVAAIDSLRIRIDERFVKDGPKYRRLVGGGNKPLRNMEQQKLVPFFYRMWQGLRSGESDSLGWRENALVAKEADAGAIYEMLCREEKIGYDPNDHYTARFAAHYSDLLSLICDFVDKVIANEQSLGRLILSRADLLEELDQIAGVIGQATFRTCSALLLAANVVAPDTVTQGERASTRLETQFLTNPHVLARFSMAVIALANGREENGANWAEIGVLAAESLTLVLSPSATVQRYLDAKLPNQAGVLVAATGLDVLLSRVEQDRLHLNLRVNELTARLGEYGESLTEKERYWLNSCLFARVLASAEARLHDLGSLATAKVANDKLATKLLEETALAMQSQVADRFDIPEDTKQEILVALEEVRRVHLMKRYPKASAASDLLKEIEYFLEYPGTRPERIQDARRPLAESAQPSVEKGSDPGTQVGDLEALSQQLRSRAMVQMTANQSDTRAGMLEVLQRIVEIGPKVATGSQVSLSRQFLGAFAETTRLYGVDPKKVLFVDGLRPYLETSFISPVMKVLERKVVLLLIPDKDMNKADERSLGEFVASEQWLRNGSFVALIAPSVHKQIQDWTRRNYPDKPIVVLGPKEIGEIARSTRNPSATGSFRRMLLAGAGDSRVPIFRSENHVDAEDAIFKGRVDAIRTLAESNQSHAIYGGRRIGKSSLLHAVKKELSKRGLEAVYISMEGSTGRELGGLVFCREVLQSLGVDKGCESLTDFRHKMREHIRVTSANVVILVDEMDRYITARDTAGEKHNLIHEMRSLQQEAEGKCRFIFSGSIEMAKHLQGKGALSGRETPWENFLGKGEPLGGLQSADAEAIVTEGFQDLLGIRLETEDIPRLIVENTTGHPAFVQKYCENLHRLIHKQRSTTLRREDVDAVFKDRSDSGFLAFVNATLKLNLTDIPRLVVSLLAVEEVDVFTVDDVRRVAMSYDPRLGGFPSDRWLDGLDQLLLTSVIRQSGLEANQYRFTVRSYPMILREFERLDNHRLESQISELLERVGNPS